jgi:hypothetical protein
MTTLTTANPGRQAGRAALVLVVLLVCACSSAPRSTASSTTAAAAATANTCEQVGAVLSDGPDPDADPVGYAEAQINPLRGISTSNRALHAAIGGLADADQNFFASKGKSGGAKEAIAVASKKLNSICPGAAS